jgi:hypothetical protein
MEVTQEHWKVEFFWYWICFSLQVRGGRVHLLWLRLALSMIPKRVGVSLTSSEDGNRSCFWNVVFYGFYNIARWANSRKPAILGMMYQIQNPLESKMWKGNLRNTSCFVNVPQILCSSVIGCMEQKAVKEYKLGFLFMGLLKSSLTWESVFENIGEKKLSFTLWGRRKGHFL